MKSGVRFGAIMLIVAAAQFIIAMLAVQAAYPCYNGNCYNIFTNPISDLGNTSTSPLWFVFNYSIIMFGMLLFVGLLGVVSAFPGRVTRRVGVGCMMLAAFGAIGVGTVPENTILIIHGAFALIAFFFAGVGITVVGIRLAIAAQRKDYQIYEIYTLLSGIISLTILLATILLPSLRLFSLNLAYSGPGFGFGGVERAVAVPPIIWILVTGIYLLLNGDKVWK